MVYSRGASGLLRLLDGGTATVDMAVTIGAEVEVLMQVSTTRTLVLISNPCFHLHV